MDSLTRDHMRSAEARRLARPGAALRWFPPRVAIALASFAIVCGTLVAVGVAEISHLHERLPDIIVSAGLGAFGAVGAMIFAIVGFVVIRRTHAGRDYRLIEAASPTHPLMKRLMTEAPGTYVHSLAVANLSEAAAEALHADVMTARVGGYYHDVGKLLNPCFFFENQEEDDNPHETTTPAESARIIKAHVTDGIVLARDYRLPGPVREIVEQHHGSSLVRYFFHKASQTDAGVVESDFRYPGQPPISREAAIVMLADASEATVRAMNHPSVDKIEEVVRRVIDERDEDGQLNESGLSAEDKETIIAVFVRQLVGICHVRCAYPER
ncbi:MAG TPA: HDIG domain-containing protein [Coriobacteriia bacterium]|nr:HDIG domain-containing protein [Coriobacteriia bacterium]